MTRNRVIPAVIAVVVLAVIAASADARFLPPDVADGPSPDIISLGGADLVNDGTGGAAWLKREGGVPHVFASTLERGRPLPPVRVDTGILTPASDLRFASYQDFGAMAVWTSAGTIYAARRPSGLDSGWEAPKVVHSATAGLPVSDVQFDVSYHGTGYVTFVQGGDLRVARLPWHERDWRVLERPLDIDPARPAGDADVAAAADGSAVVVWAETVDGVSQIWVRRITDDGELSAAPRQVSVPSLQGRPGGNADSPDVHVQDDSTYALIAVRQDFTDAGVVVSRAYGRRLEASQLEGPQPIDSLAFPTADGAGAPRIQVSGRGRGTTMVPLRSGAAVGSVVMREEPLDADWRNPRRLDVGANVPEPPPVTASMAEGEAGVLAWQQTPVGGIPSVRARQWEDGEYNPEVTLSPPQFGPTAAQLGFFSASDARTDSIIGFIQGAESERRVMIAAWDGPIRPAAIPLDDDWTRNTRPTLRWRAVTNVLWGPVRYSIRINGVQAALTRRTRWRSPTRLPDGANTVEIVQLDGRGVESPGLPRPVKIDTTAPVVRLDGRTLRVTDGGKKRGSGVRSVRVYYGSRSAPVRLRRGRARVRRRPSKIVAVDRVGNRRTISGRAAAR
jgi:hypothetical protein